MKLSSILNIVASCTAEFPNGEKLTIQYRPGVYTPKFESEVLIAASSGDKDALSCRLAPMIVAWDLTEEDGTPVPHDQATLHGLPTMILSAAIRAILEDMSPNRKTSGSSASG